VVRQHSMATEHNRIKLLTPWPGIKSEKRKGLESHYPFEGSPPMV
jgi:hypothetical protein